ncbi:MAG: hypothetical protein ACKPFF_22525, partial [Planktothrix sp.]
PEEKPTRVLKLPKFRIFNRGEATTETPEKNTEPANVSKIPQPRTKPGLNILNRLQSPPRLPKPEE